MWGINTSYVDFGYRSVPPKILVAVVLQGSFRSPIRRDPRCNPDVYTVGASGEPCLSGICPALLSSDLHTDSTTLLPPYCGHVDEL